MYHSQLKIVATSTNGNAMNLDLARRGLVHLLTLSPFCIREPNVR